KGFSPLVEKRHDRGVNPIDRAVFRAIAKFTVPSLPFRYRRPKIADEFFRVKTGINNAVVLSYEFLSTVFRYLAEFIVNVCNYSALIGTRDDRCLIKGELDILKLL